MSTSGHYTRYINKNPGWLDGGDTMVYPIYINGEKLGYFQIEHNRDNTISECVFFAVSEPMGLSRNILTYKGKNAIQNTLRIINGDMTRIIQGLKTVI